MIKSLVYLLRSSLFCYAFPSKLRIIPYSFLCVQCRNDVNLLSILWEHDSSGGSLQHTPAKIESIVGSNGRKLVGFLMAAMSSGSGSKSGFLELVG